MKKLLFLAPCILFVLLAKAQSEKKPVTLVFNNGLGSAGIHFTYAESFEAGAETREFSASRTSPYVANPGIRFYTKRGFNEIGFNNILLGSLSNTTYNSTLSSINYEYGSLFSSSVYFNKSFEIGHVLGGDLFAGIEPTFGYQTVSRVVNQLDYLYVGRTFTGDCKLLLRWEQYFTDNIFISLVGGASPFLLERSSVQHRLTDIETPIVVNSNNFQTRLSQVVQITFGIKI